MNNEERNARIKDDFFDHGLSYAELKLKYGLSVTSIQRMMNTAKTSGRKRVQSERVDPRSLEARKAISPVHLNIGMEVLRYRVMKDWRVTEMGQHIQISRAKVGQLEAGALDVTIGQVQRIADKIGVSFESLITPKAVADIHK